MIPMKNNQAKLTLIDDDLNYLQILSISLSDDFKINTFYDPKLALEDLKTSTPDGVLLDLHMGEVKGFEVCYEIKLLQPELPVFFLTSDLELNNITEGFRKGATDYFPKSMPREEMISRVNARLRVKTKTILRCRDIEMNTESFEVKVQGDLVNFTPKEFNILKVCLEHQDVVLSKKRLLSLLWRGENVDANNIDTHMFHIRKKIDHKTSGIECRKGLGYILRSKV